MTNGMTMTNAKDSTRDASVQFARKVTETVARSVHVIRAQRQSPDPPSKILAPRGPVTSAPRSRDSQ
jgi:hypothetical protein